MSVETVFDIEVKRFPRSSRFFGSVEHGDSFGSLWQGCEEVLCRERAVEVYCHETYLFAFCHEVVNGLAYGFCHRTHCYDDTFCVFCSVVVEQTVFPSGNLGYFIHVFFHDGRYGIVISVR